MWVPQVIPIPPPAELTEQHWAASALDHISDCGPVVFSLSLWVSKASDWIHVSQNVILYNWQNTS